MRLDKLFHNNGDGTFSDITRESGISGDDPKDGGAFGDYNNDGFTDIFVTTSDYIEPVAAHRLYRNRGNENKWLTVKLVGVKSNRNGVGARIILSAGGLQQIREVSEGSSFLSQDDLRQTFGLGSSSQADAVRIVWPSGITKTLNNVQANQKMVVWEE